MGKDSPPVDVPTIAAQLQANAALRDAAEHGEGLGSAPPGAAGAPLSASPVWGFLKQLPVDQIALIVKEVIALLPVAH